MLSKEKRAELKEAHKDKDLKVVTIGAETIVFILPGITEIGKIRQKQFELFAPTFRAVSTAVKDGNTDVNPESIPDLAQADNMMADFIYETVVVYPEKINEAIKLNFAEWFVDNYVYVQVGNVEDL